MLGMQARSASALFESMLRFGTSALFPADEQTASLEAGVIWLVGLCFAKGGGGLNRKLGGIAELGLSVWKTTALKTAIVAAQKAGAAAGVAAGEAAGKKAVIKALEIYDAFVKTPHYADVKNFVGDIVSEHTRICQSLDLKVTTNPTCETFDQVVPEVLDSLVWDIKEVAEAKDAKVTAAKQQILTYQTLVQLSLHTVVCMPPLLLPLL
ncbi:hypothetical protein PFDG_05180 [Plasmodium falciparum Dd2]|uniref:Uncharacterized protein n=1 Tax=Plasmodium falciparum (isolate Dd2) TaxID=57267 RepID=A0A0L7MAJ7_PLAF4|nr:hypothetical protein PFDG_05180 [Plasmodium falciparum Dd2]